MIQREIKARFALVGPTLEIRENIKIVLDQNNVIREIDELGSQVSDNNLLIPGLFNAHVHSADIALRNKVNRGNLAKLVGPGGIKHKHLESLSATELTSSIRKSYDEALHSGVLGWADFREGGLKGVKPYPIDENSNFIPFARISVDDMNMLPSFSNIGLRDVQINSVHEMREIAGIAKHLGKLIWIHASEDQELREKWLEHHSRSDIIWAIDELNVDCVIHLTHADKYDIDHMEKHNVGGVICWYSNQFTRAGEPPLELLLESGLNIGIGTDNAMISHLSIWRELKNLSQKIQDSRRLLQMGTVEGANLTGLRWGIEKQSSNFLNILLPKGYTTRNIYSRIVVDPTIENRIQERIVGEGIQ